MPDQPVCECGHIRSAHADRCYHGECRCREFKPFKAPRLSVVQTVGGYYRVIVHGVDNLGDGERYAEMDISRGATKSAALQQARSWFRDMKDNVPTPVRPDAQES